MHHTYSKEVIDLAPPMQMTSHVYLQHSLWLRYFDERDINWNISEQIIHKDRNTCNVSYGATVRASAANINLKTIIFTFLQCMCSSCHVEVDNSWRAEWQVWFFPLEREAWEITSILHIYMYILYHARTVYDNESGHRRRRFGRNAGI